MEYQLTYWHWWILAMLFIAIEVFSPMVIFLWMGAAAGVVGLVLLVAPGVDWQYQVLLFSLCSVASIIGWRWYLGKHPTRTDRPDLNRRGEQYLNRVFTLTDPIVDGRGRVRVGDSTWTIAGHDCPAGTKVRVRGVEGNLLQVAPLEGEDAR
uniref:NfeD-like C-terminal domain-containing protein n=1 Tax=Candidatus Kentrum sp. DK TaxID=2126562 RepID=A0A450S949_9GAMM|nr:MAG: hypothetical protein BECKDK2373C_GA0170839_102211 [Candidatus Kentron sp. DK]